VVLEALAHTISWAASAIHSGGWAAVSKAITGNPMEMWGFIVSILLDGFRICAHAI
jgi:hypothetical protein